MKIIYIDIETSGLSSENDFIGIIKHKYEMKVLKRSKLKV